MPKVIVNVNNPSARKIKEEKVIAKQTDELLCINCDRNININYKCNYTPKFNGLICGGRWVFNWREEKKTVTHVNHPHHRKSWCSSPDGAHNHHHRTSHSYRTTFRYSAKPYAVLPNPSFSLIMIKFACAVVRTGCVCVCPCFSPAALTAHF